MKKKRKIELMSGDIDLGFVLPPSEPGCPDPMNVDAGSATEPSSARTAVFSVAKDVDGKEVDFRLRRERNNIEPDLRNGLHISKIKVDSITWYYDEVKGAVIKGLLEASQSVDDKGDSPIHYYNIKKEHGIDRESRRDPILITRTHSRGVAAAVESVVTSDRESSVTYIVGPPGVGKTRTLQLVLRDYILKRKGEPTSVRYYDQKQDAAIWIIGIQEKLWVFSAEEATPKDALFSQDMNDCFFGKSLALLDPREATSGGAVFVAPVNIHLVVACSSNEAHFKNATPSKASDIFQFYLGLWSRVELRRANELRLFAVEAGDTIDDSVIDERANVVGEAPRYIFSKSKYEKRKGMIWERSHSLGTDIVQSALTNSKVERNGTVAGCFFAHVNHTFGDNPIEDKTEQDYTVPKIRFLSRFAIAVAYEQHRATMLQALHNSDTPDGGGLFELLVGFDVHAGGDFLVRKMPYTSKEGEAKSKFEIAVLDPHARTKFLLPDTPAGITRTSCVQPFLKNGTAPCANGATLVGLSKAYPGIDYVGVGRQVYQATVGTDHDRNGWVELLKDADILVEVNAQQVSRGKKKKGKAKKLAIVPDAKKLIFNWVVPFGKKDKWSNDAKKVRVSDVDKDLEREDRDLVNTALQQHVEQRVILIAIHREQIIGQDFTAGLPSSA